MKNCKSTSDLASPIIISWKKIKTYCCFLHTLLILIMIFYTLLAHHNTYLCSIVKNSQFCNYNAIKINTDLYFYAYFIVVIKQN